MIRKELLDAALALAPREPEPMDERLIERLIPKKAPAPDELERAWLGELKLRSEEIDAGTAELVDWADVRSRIAARRK